MQKNRAIVIHRWLMVMIGVLALFAGTLVYLIDRPPEETYFVIKSLPQLSLHDKLPPVFGKAGNVLPDFAHPFAFSLITAGLFAKTRSGAFMICLFWFCVNTAFELGQHYKSFAVSLVPRWFDTILLLENCKDFFRNGSFDPFDLLAILTGSLAAGFVAARVFKPKN